jgi:alkylation response protein AidB-like acyl-CoA dehydrogenase
MSAAHKVVVSAQIVDDPVARARRVAPLIAAAASRIEADRALPAELLEALYENRIIRTLLPKAVGGDETSPETYVRMMAILAAADASAAWCIGQASGCSMSAAYMDIDAVRTIWAPREASLAWGVILPNQTARVTEGGYSVNGTWSFASGGRHATWFGGHCKVLEADGTPRLDPDGVAADRTMMFPASAISMTANWDVMGLRGTGSDTYAVKDLFVPEALTVRRDLEGERRPHGHGPLYRFTTTHLYAAGFAGVALGIARGLLDAFVALAVKKTPQATARRLADSPALQSGLAQAEGQWRAARAGLLMTLRECWADAEAGNELTADQKVSIRLASTFAIHQAKAAADFAYCEAGASAIFESGPFERRFRDIHAVTQQVQARKNHFETVGQHLFGLEPNPRFL